VANLCKPSTPVSLLGLQLLVLFRERGGWTGTLPRFDAELINGVAGLPVLDREQARIDTHVE
jgi:hypothetical protein